MGTIRKLDVFMPSAYARFRESRIDGIRAFNSGPTSRSGGSQTAVVFGSTVCKPSLLEVGRFIQSEIQMLILFRHWKYPHFVCANKFSYQLLQRKIGSGERSRKTFCGLRRINRYERLRPVADDGNSALARVGEA